MKKGINSKIKLGLFATLAVIFLITGIYLIGKRQQLFSTNFQISGIFNDVSGLQIGSSVRFSGIDIGVVEDIQITTDTTVKVDLLIDERVKKFIKKDSRAIIGTEGIMGNKIVTILPGKNGGKIIEDNDIITTVPPFNIENLLNKIDVITDNAAYITYDLAEITSVIRSGEGTVGKLFMDSSFAENLDKTLMNVRSGARSFNQNMEAAKSNILLRGYFKKKEREKQKEQEKKQEEKEQQKKSK